MHRFACICFCMLSIPTAGLVSVAGKLPAPCAIEVVEKGTGWPVPLVELRTTHQMRFVSDNAGRIALNQQELMGVETWFDIHGHGYGVPKDRFGYQGVRLVPRPGALLKVEVQRQMLASRLGRITGGGLFSESQKLGWHQDWVESGIVGSDSVQSALHNGRLFWIWGDTTLPGYPLGIFHASSATSPIPALESLKPPIRPRLSYFRDPSGKVRGVCKMPGDGPTWVTGYASLPDRTGTARLVGAYMKIKPPLEAYEWGLAVWNDSREEFERIKVVWSKTETSPKPPPIPEGQTTKWKDPATGSDWILFGNPLPTLKCPATFEDWSNPASWQILAPQRDLLSRDGLRVEPHSGSVSWNGFRKKWVTVFVEKFGKPSAFGEVWYAEAIAPTGPWNSCVKVLSHDNYTFYNPKVNPEFSPESSPLLFFEGTFSKDFADRPQPTPQHDYNQILYQLDLNDPRIAGDPKE